MKLEEFASILEETGYPVAKDEFPLEVSVNTPYIIYEVDGSRNLFADNQVFYKVLAINIMLFTDKADDEPKEVLEEVLANHNIPWQYDSTYDHDEYDYETVYNVEV